MFPLLPGITQFPLLKTLLFCSLLTAVPAMLVAQPGRGGRGAGGTFSGTLLDELSGEGIPGGSIALWNAADSTLFGGAVSRIDGTFTIEGVRPGTYYVKISALGYVREIIDDITLGRSSMRSDLGTISMRTDSAGRDESVTVTAERSTVEFRSDRTVYNVEDQPVTAGGDAIDVLKNVPQVDVDIDDNISLRGNQNVVVMINGRSVNLSGDALAGFLKSLSADAISSIEVIPNPSAKYDPEGMAGMLNIVMAKDKDNDNVSGTISVGAGTTNSYNANASLNWRTDRITWFGSYSFRYDERESERTLYRENRLLDPVTILEQESTGSSIDRSHVLNTSIEYGLNDHNFLSASAMFNTRGGMDGDRIFYTESALSSEVMSRTLRLSPEDENRTHTDFSLGYRWMRKPGSHELSTEVRYNTFDRDDLGTFAEYHQLGSGLDTLVERQNNDALNNNRELSFQTDYVRPIGERGRLEAGYKGEWNRINNEIYSETFTPTVGEFQPDLDLNNEFIYDENLQALYAIYGQEFGDFEAQAGVRAEGAYTSFELLTTDETFENNYFSLFPSASLSYALDESKQLRASYSRRIRRPGVWRLNPFTQFEDRLNLRTGNPELKPEYVNSIEVGYNQFLPWGTISLTPYFRRTANEIERVLTIDSTGVSTLTFENFAGEDSYGAEFVGTWRAGDWLSGFLNVSAYRIVLDAGNVDSDLSNNAIGWSTRANATVKIIDGLDVQASYFYRAPVDISQGRIDAMQGADLAIKKTLWGDRANISLRISDVFNTRNFELWRDSPEYYVEIDHRRTSQVAWLNFSWNFGSDDARTDRRRGNREGGGDDEGGADMDF